MYSRPQPQCTAPKIPVPISPSFITTPLAVFLLTLLALAPAPPLPPTTRPTVRVAALGPINDAGFWSDLSSRFESQSGIHIETVISGNKDAIADRFRQGGIDLITLQSPDPLIQLAAEGYVQNLTPWVQIQLIIVGPPADPAGIRNMTDASAAINKILASKSPFVLHANLGVDQLVRSLLQANKLQLQEGQAILLNDDHQKRAFLFATEKNAYTLIAANPFLSGKLTPPPSTPPAPPTTQLIPMVTNSPLLRRPLLLAQASPTKLKDTHTDESQKLAAFLTSKETQQYIATWKPTDPASKAGFFPVATP